MRILLSPDIYKGYIQLNRTLRFDGQVYGEGIFKDAQRKD